MTSAPTQLKSSSEWRQRKRGKELQYEEVLISTIAAKSKRFFKQPVLIAERVVCCIAFGGMDTFSPLQPSLPTLPHFPSLPPTSHNHRLATRRASQRWSTLVSAPTSRIAKVMSPVLGDLWPDFLAHASLYARELCHQLNMPHYRRLRTVAA